VQNRAGRFVQPNAETFQAAAAGADWGGSKDFFLVMTDAPGENAFPITATSFVIMHKQPKDMARAKVALDFFKWALESGQVQADSLHYVPLPKPLVQQVVNYLKSEFGQ
jgi:phosphate transport system substrate-binding protein